MRILEHHGKHGRWHLAFHLSVEGDQDAAQARTEALEVLKEYVAGLESLQATMHHRAEPKEGKDAVRGPFHEGTGRPKRPSRTDSTPLPRLSSTAQQAVDNFLMDLWRLGVGGRAVRYQHLLNAGYKPAQLSRLLAEGSDTLEVIKSYTQIARSGRHRVFDLTEDGRLHASRLRVKEMSP